MSKNTLYPVLYVKEINSRFYKHCGIYPTVYFKIENTKELEQEPYYCEYMDQIRKEAMKAICHQFTMSCPTTVSNDQEVFVIFKDNVELEQVKNFCIQILEELEYFTKKTHVAQFATLETMLMIIDRPVTLFKMNKVGEKLTQTDILSNLITEIDGHEDPQDNGCVTTYEDFIREKENPVQIEEPIDEEWLW